MGDAVPAPGWALDPEVSNDAIRTRFDLLCRKCRKPLAVRAEKLFSLLDGWHTAGVSEIPLAAIAASLELTSRSRPDDDVPELGQGNPGNPVPQRAGVISMPGGTFLCRGRTSERALPR